MTAGRRASQRTLSRRAFVRAAAGAAALAASGAASGTLAGCSSNSSEDISVLEVASSDVVTLDDFTEYESSSYYTIDDVGSFNDGLLLSASDSDIAATLCTGESADPINSVGLINLSSGAFSRVLTQAIADADGFSFLNVTASSELLVWVESNFLTSEWRVYCATISTTSLSIGQATQLDSGDADYDAPEIAAIGSTAYWIVQPAADGSKTEEDSYLKLSAAGSEASVLHTSHGRFNGSLATSGTVLTAMPRAEADSGVYYQLTAWQSGTGEVLATQVMPKSFKPLCAVYMGGSFSFCIEAAYDYGDGIADVGTYYQLDDGTWLRLTRQPVAPAGLCNGWLVSKSGSRTALVDLVNRGYLTIDAPEDCADYGDYPVCAGESEAVCVYAHVTQEDDEGTETSSTYVRRIVPKAQS